MREPTLFPMPEPEPEPVPAPARREEARLVRPVRDQVEFVPRTLEELVAPGHPARAIWRLLEGLGLGAVYGAIRATLDRPGRPATDPQVLLAVWLLGTGGGGGGAGGLGRRGAAADGAP